MATIKKLVFENSNYLNHDKIELWGFGNILKCHYKQINESIPQDASNKNDFYFLISQEIESDICSLINKINFQEGNSNYEHFEGNSTGYLTVVLADNTTQTVEFKSALPEYINELQKLIINSLDTNNDIDVEWLLTELLIYYVLTTSNENETLTVENCLKVLQKELEESKKNTTLFDKFPQEHPITELYSIFNGMDKTTYQVIINTLLPKLIDYHLFGNTNKLMSLSSSQEIHEFARVILSFYGLGDLKNRLTKLRNCYYYKMNVNEQQKIDDLKLNDVILKLQSSSYQVKYIENMGYVIIKYLGYLHLVDGSEIENYSAQKTNSEEIVKNEIVKIYNDITNNFDKANETYQKIGSDITDYNRKSALENPSKISEIKNALRKKALGFETGGIRPTNQLGESWIGKVCWQAQGDTWPLGEDGEKMIPLATLFVDGSEYIPNSLKDIKMINIFVDVALLDNLAEDSYKKWFKIYTYESLDNLVKCDYTSEQLIPFTLTPQVIDNEFPEWEDVGDELLDIISAMEENDNIEYYRDIYEDNYHSHKIGGYPSTIQGGLEYGEGYEFVLQISSDEKAEFNIVDGGNFYFGYNSTTKEWEVRCDFY